MASPVVTKIAEASKQAWPLVSPAVALTMRSIEELAGIAGAAVPAVQEYFARGDGQKLKLRKVCEETVWVLAQLGWLRTGAERDVILAAKAWVDADPKTATNTELDAVDEKLALAVLALPEYHVPEKD